MTAGILNWRVVAPGVFSAGQPAPSQWREVAAAGIGAVVNLRPAAEQPDVDPAALARAQGLDYHEFPVASIVDLRPERVAEFAALVDRLRRGGVLVHCGSGNRVGALFALARGREAGVSVNDALAFGRSAGLTGLEPAVAGLLQQWRG